MIRELAPAAHAATPLTARQAEVLRLIQRFYEATMPTLVRELAKLNSNLERLLVVLERKPDPKTTASETPR